MPIRQKDDYFERLLKKYLPKIKKAIKIDYGVGSAISITNAKLSGKETKMNPLSMTKQDQEANIDIMQSLIKDVNREMSKKINYAVNENITNNGTNKELADNLKELFKKDSSNYFDYKNRFDNIAITESTRIMNTSANNTALRLGAKKKYLDNPMDKKTGDDSKVSQQKYGDEDKAIPIDKPFRYTYNGKVREFMLPPDRPRDRSLVYYVY